MTAETTAAAYQQLDDDATATALSDMTTIIRTAWESGFTNAECDAARDGLSASMPMLYEHAALVAAQATELHAHGLPHDFLTHTLETITNLTAPDIHDALWTHLHPDRLSLIAIGDPAHHQPLQDQLNHELDVLPQ